MTSLATWSTAPKIDNVRLEKEKKAMSFREMEAALIDMNGSLVVGVGSKDGEQNDGYRRLKQEVARLDAAINLYVEIDCKGALTRATEECPDQVRYLKELFISTTESPRKMEDIARKVCAHWELRVKVFGEERAFLPMTLDGALKDDMYALAHIDYVHLIPNAEDRYGRGIMYKQCGCHFRPKQDDRNGVLRAVWYMLDAATRSAKDPSKGIVMLVNTEHMELETSDRKLIRLVYEVESHFPVTIRAHHYSQMPWFSSLVWPAILFCMGKDRRNRIKVHPGSHAQVLKSLSGFGIEPMAVPIEMGGSVEFDVKQWLSKRRDQGL